MAPPAMQHISLLRASADSCRSWPTGPRPLADCTRTVKTVALLFCKHCRQHLQDRSCFHASLPTEGINNNEATVAYCAEEGVSKAFSVTC